jgi:hypothetical protein
MKESTNHMKNARAIAAASLPSHCLIISCPKSSPKLQIWTQIFFIIIIIFFFFFFTQICITQISFFFFFFFIQMLLNSWFSVRVWEDTDRQTDRDLSLGSSVLSCYFGLVGCCCCFLLASFLFG